MHWFSSSSSRISCSIHSGTGGTFDAPTTGDTGRRDASRGWAAYASGAIAAVGLVFFVALYAAFAAHWEVARLFGWLNDVLVIVRYFIALPIALALHTPLGPRNLLLSQVAMVIGIGGMLAVVVLQLLLVVGALTFQQQVVPVSIALLVVGAWLVITGYPGRSTLPHSLRMSLLAAPYFGYPIWGPSGWGAACYRSAPPDELGATDDRYPPRRGLQVTNSWPASWPASTPLLAEALSSAVLVAPKVVRLPLLIRQRRSNGPPRCSADSHEILREAR